MLNDLYPQSLISRGVQFSSDHSSLELYPEEAIICKTFGSLKRIEEFSKGRVAARAALRAVGVENFPLLKAITGNPLWPENVTGSITHSNGIAVAAAARKNNLHAIGIDLEFKGKKRDLKLFDKISTNAELSWINEPSEVNKVPTLRGLQIFSAKEAIYKAFFELLGVKLTFQDAELTWQKNSFECKINLNSYKTCEVFQSQNDDYILSSLVL